MTKSLISIFLYNSFLVYLYATTELYVQYVLLAFLLEAMFVLAAVYVKRSISSKLSHLDYSEENTLSSTAHSKQFHGWIYILLMIILWSPIFLIYGFEIFIGLSVSIFILLFLVQFLSILYIPYRDIKYAEIKYTDRMMRLDLFRLLVPLIFLMGFVSSVDSPAVLKEWLLLVLVFKFVIDIFSTYHDVK